MTPTPSSTSRRTNFPIARASLPDVDARGGLERGPKAIHEL
jgi:hypothetical protein